SLAPDLRRLSQREERRRVGAGALSADVRRDRCAAAGNRHGGRNHGIDRTGDCGARMSMWLRVVLALLVLLAPGRVCAQIIRDTTSDSNVANAATSSDNITSAITAAVGSTLIVSVINKTTGGGSGISSVKYNGVSLTAARSRITG